MEPPPWSSRACGAKLRVVPFAHPHLLYGLLLLPLLALLFLASLLARRQRLARLLAPQRAREHGVRPLPLRRRLRGLVLFVSVGLLVAALARPQWGERVEEVHERGLDLMVCLDCSTSMLAEDLKPSRLARARHAVERLLGQLSGDRVGIVAFAGTAFPQCPLTVDYGAARMFLDLLDPSMFESQGTDLAAAVTTAVRALEKGGEGAHVILLLSDGEGHGSKVEEAIRAAKGAGIRVYTVGLGTPGGAPIPLRDAKGHLTGYKKDRRGEVVITRLVPDDLARLALETGGAYFQATPGDPEMGEVVAQMASLARAERATRLTVQHQERYLVFLLPALLLLLLDAAWPEGRREVRA